MSGLNSIPASQLKVGDMVEVWWRPKQATVNGFSAHLSGNEKWIIARFSDGRSMTVTPEMTFKRAR